MPTIKDVRIVGNGSITYQQGVDPRPETKETRKDGNVTINNITAARAGIPAHYQVSFMIQATVDQDGIETNNTFHWNSVVAEQNEFAPYRSVEDAAARQVAPMFRSLADRIDSQLPDFSGSQKNDDSSTTR